MSRKHKFDLTHLVHLGSLKEGETLAYVSDPKMTCKIVKQPNGEFKVLAGGEMMTVHAFAQKCLGQDPPDHASKWLKSQSGKILFDLWHAEEEDAA